MTPAIEILEDNQTPHEVLRYDASQAHSHYGLDASEQLGIPPERVFKTLVAETDAHELIVALVPVSTRLHLKSLATAAGAKKVVIAYGAKVEKTTGYVLGGVSPLGQKKALRTFINDSARGFATIYVSGGRRGLEIALAADALAELLDARFAVIAEAI